MTPMKPAILFACVLLAGCDDYDSLYGGRDRGPPEFSDPTDDDEPGESFGEGGFDPGPIDPDPIDPDPTDPAPTDPIPGT
jgi:hypothetical protein